MAANIVVIDKDAHQCKEVTTKTNKGVYIWKATVSGVIKSIKCKIGNGVITHECDETGRWVNLNHSSCDYTNEFNRKLQILAAVIILAFTSFIISSIQLQWLERLLNHGNMFETWVVQANECLS